MEPLPKIHADIENRVIAIREAHPQWLCGKGCAGCCQRLADVPQLTAPEWALLETGLAALPKAQQAEIGGKMEALSALPAPPVVCPLLDPASGTCRVYAQRPVACRTYGFYRQRDFGLYCQDIESLVAAAALDDVVWGNHDAVDLRLAALGESRALTAWFSEWKKV
ncbi:MAG: YkgJ family cysteine cluster protein [Betaproteobacteria bacterium]